MHFNKAFLFFSFILMGFLGYFFYTRKQASHVGPHNVQKNMLEKKQENTLLRVGVNAEYPPFAFMQDNTIVGFDIDVLREVAKRLDKNLEVKDLPFDALIPGVQQGAFHVAASGMTPAPERKNAVLFTDVYFGADPLVILTKKESPSATIDDLHGKRVVVNEGFTADYFISKVESITDIMRLATVNEAILALNSGRVDAFVTAQSSLASFFAQHDKSNFNVAVIPDTQEQYAFVVSKQHPAYQDLINQVLKEMTQDGTLETIKKKWNLI